MMSIHHFVAVREFEKLKQKLSIAENQTNQICKQVTPQFAAPLSEMTARSCRLRAFDNSAFSASVPSDYSPSLIFSSSATNKYEVHSWSLINSNSLYDSSRTSPIVQVVGELEEEVNYIVKKATAILSFREGKEITLLRLVGCYVRYSGSRGREYLLDMIVNGRGEEVEERRRVSLLRPHTPDVIVLESTVLEKVRVRVNIVVPLSRVGDRYTKFLTMYEDAVLKAGENVRLILVVFGPEASAVQRYLSLYQRRFPEAQFMVVTSSEEFTRSKALHLGLTKLKGSELAFLCDVDMTFGPSLLDHCRLNTVQGRRVYYPEFFKYYDMDYVYRFKKKPTSFPIKRPHGHWASYSYGMLCIYKSDYDNSGGFDLTIRGWGGEDVDLLEHILAVGLEVLKAPEPAFSHRYHDKTCSRYLSPQQLAMCISSRSEGLADRKELSEYVFHLEKQCGIRERVLWA